MNQIMTLLSLYSEIIACLLAASILSLFIGWMMHRSVAKRHLRKAIRAWAKRYQSLEVTAAADVDNLEEQLQHLANEAKTLQSTNRVLTDSLKKNDTSIQKARAEAIELNRQHAETQERLQRIIQQKDREIVELGNRVNQAAEWQKNATSNSAGLNATAPLQNGQMSHSHDSDLNHADTVAMNPTEFFDSTVQMSTNDFIHKAASANSMNIEADDTAAMSDDELEESTVVLDEEAMAFAQRSYPTTERD